MPWFEVKWNVDFFPVSSFGFFFQGEECNQWENMKTDTYQYIVGKVIVSI
jgi:hypothetical protein